MGMFEWLGESWNPGPSGRLELNGDAPVRRIWLPFTLVRFSLTVGLLPVVVGAALWAGSGEPFQGFAAGAVYVAYLVVGYVIRPNPDTSNVGMLGGLVDHPFRVSDDWNRFLVMLGLLLFPGYLLARPIAELFAYLSGDAR